MKSVKTEIDNALRASRSFNTHLKEQQDYASAGKADELPTEFNDAASVAWEKLNDANMIVTRMVKGGFLDLKKQVEVAEKTIFND